MIESLFEFLFKYRPLVFERGELAFDPPWPAWTVVLLLAAAAALAALPYARARADLGARERAGLAVTRFAAFALLLFCVSRPMLVVATVVPQQNFLGILLDDSRSMEVADGGMARRATALELFGAQSPLVAQLAERFKLRVFAFGETVERVGAAEELSFGRRRTDLAGALDGARRDLASVPLAGLVLVTDGADNAGGALDETLLELRAAGVPVYPVGLGRERPGPDLEVSRLETPYTALVGSSVAVDVALAHTGYRGRTVTVSVEDEGRIVASQDVVLPAEGEPVSARLHFTLTQPGPRLIRASVPPAAGELLSHNNTIAALTHVTDRRERILYFEGEPRFEIKFLRRAVADDEQLQVVTLLRTAENKFLRLDVRDSTELAGGFPTSRRDLFAYRGLILGSVEASFFTRDQLRMLADFVSQRGGGLLVLGGRHAFAEGGYGATPLATALPVTLPEGVRRDTSRFFAELKARPTPFGRTHPALQFAGAAAAAERWRTLPPLSTVNPIARVKPGASTLLLGERAGGDPLVMLAFHRFGRGKVIAFPVQDSWIWQMHAEIPLEDMTHETLWRQLLRWLVSGVPDRVTVAVSADRVDVGRPVDLTALVVDDDYLELNGGDVTATVVTPSGEERFVPLPWTVRRNGEYRARLTPAEPGLHELRVEARQGGRTIGAATAYVHAGDTGAEYFGVGMRKALLERIAEQTGGRFYTPATAPALAEDVSFTESGATVREERSLWDMPAVFLLLITLVSGEWLYRRRRGLA